MNSSASPCIDICAMDPETRLCRGCFRTIEEIAAWPGLNEQARAALRAALAQRGGAERRK